MWRNLLIKENIEVYVICYVLKVFIFIYLFTLAMSQRTVGGRPVTKQVTPKPKFDINDDDWDTDISYEVYLSNEYIVLIRFYQNPATEKSQRYGSKSVPGSGRVNHVDFNSIRDKIQSADETVKGIYQEKNPNRGYGGKYGVEQITDKVI